ncbi:hypothetical protein MMC22_011746 [Lobaria immixta]|nr:hypothetical protein [Lobaria immixta]
MQGLLIVIASFSAAFPLQDDTESYSAKVPVLEGLTSSSIDYSVPIGEPNDFLAFNSGTNLGTNLGSNSETGSGILQTSNSESPIAVFDPNNQGSSNLDKSTPSVSFGSAPLVPPSDWGTPEVNSENVESPGVINSAITNPLIVAQDPTPMCASDGTKATKTEDPKPADICPSPEWVLKTLLENMEFKKGAADDPTPYDEETQKRNDAIKKNDENWFKRLESHPEDLRLDVDMDKDLAGITFVLLGPIEIDSHIGAVYNHRCHHRGELRYIHPGTAVVYELG